MSAPAVLNNGSVRCFICAISQVPLAAVSPLFSFSFLIDFILFFAHAPFFSLVVCVCVSVAINHLFPCVVVLVVCSFAFVCSSSSAVQLQFFNRIAFWVAGLQICEIVVGSWQLAVGSSCSVSSLVGLYWVLEVHFECLLHLDVCLYVFLSEALQHCAN